jgi:hypothetical protein
MKRMAVVFAGAALCSALLACVAHDNTNFPTPPPPGDATSPARIVVDSGLVIFSEDDGGANPDIGGVGEITHDARALPDSSPDLATPDLGGVGSPCDLLAQKCAGGQACYPVSGAGVCSPAGTFPELVGCNPDDPYPECQRGLTCVVSKVLGYECTRLCSMDPNVAGPVCDVTSKNPVCQPLPGSKTVGFCSD